MLIMGKKSKLKNKILSTQLTNNHTIYRTLGIKISIPRETKNIEDELVGYKQSYEDILERIRNSKKIRVAFYVFEISKWKTDTLYKLMQEDERFEPFIVYSFVPLRVNQYVKEKRYEEQIEYFKNKGMVVYLGYDVKKDKYIPLEEYKPDIVFYQQHLGNIRINDIDEVSKYALCCYVPYNVPNYVNAKYDYSNFCTKLFRFYTLNDRLKDEYSKNFNYSENIRSVGHTALDLFYLNKNKKSGKKYIIYAPHFSIQHPLIHNKFYYSTFTQNYKVILQYAQKHPEYTWVFKPHPNLKWALEKMNVSESVINDYYNEWRKIGIVSDDADYFEYFINSKAMLTDCGSFLTEYFCTGKPLIHMINTNSFNFPCAAMKPMFECFYETHDNTELLSTIERVIIKDDDYKANERERTRKLLSFTEQYAAKNIIDDLKKEIYS